MLSTPARRWAVTGVSFAAAVGASLWVVASTWPAGGAAALPWGAHALALSATLLEIGSRAVKVHLSARALGISLSYGAALRTVLGGDFAASVTPARSGAEPARFLVLAESGVAAAPALLVLFAELFLEMLSLALVGVVLALVFRHAGAAALGGVATVVAGFAAFVLGAGAVAVLLTRRRRVGVGPNAVGPPAWAARVGLTPARWGALDRAVAQMHASLRGLRGADRNALLAAYAASVAHVLFRLAVLPALVLVAAPEVAAGPLVLWPMALFYGGIVAPAPGGAGFVEVAFRATLGRGAIPARLFAASLVWWRFYTFYLYIALGALAAGGTVMRALRAGGGDADDAARRAA
ncbi:MAG TPA: lysylphosphatidylglycerol synthase transmembrane domain-containing protein [Gemmatimonadaceae bacterium]|nr:lysylphosphatidylglycerol synthase transmembrane domain-containing protein [Gemmatimonadaceae bacterium]